MATGHGPPDMRSLFVLSRISTLIVDTISCNAL